MHRLPYWRSSEIVLLVTIGAVNSPLSFRKGERMKVRGFFKLAKAGGQLVIFSASVTTLLVGCEKNSEIKVYRVSKAPLEQSAPQQQDAMPTNTAAPRMPGGLPPATEAAVTIPPNWEAQPLSQMRQENTANRVPTDTAIRSILMIRSPSPNEMLNAA